MGIHSILAAFLAFIPVHDGAHLKGAEAVKELNDFRSQTIAAMQKSGKPMQYADFVAAMKGKAVELTTGVDLTDVPAAEGMDWSKIYTAAQRYQEANTLLEKFIETKPAAPEIFEAQTSEVSNFQQLKDWDGAEKVLKGMKPSNDKDYLRVAGLDSMVASYIEDAKDAQSALRFLDAVSGNVASAPIKQRADLVETKVEFLQELGKDREANRLLDKSIGEFKGTPVPSNLADLNVRTKLTNRPAPALGVLPDKYGSFSSLPALKGKVVILDFFAHWCGPCKASMPNMRQLRDDLGAKLQVVGVTAYYGSFGSKQNVPKAEEYADMKGFMEQYKIDHPVVYIDKADFRKYGVSGIPEFVLIGKDGKVKKIQLGYSEDSFKKFRAAVEAATKA